MWIKFDPFFSIYYGKNAGLLLSALLWLDNSNTKNFKIQFDLKLMISLTGLSKNQIYSTLKILERKKVIKRLKKGKPPKLYILVNRYQIEGLSFLYWALWKKLEGNITIETFKRKFAKDFLHFLKTKKLPYKTISEPIDKIIREKISIPKPISEYLNQILPSFFSKSIS